MKLPSINYLIKNAKESFVRFPITISVSFLASCLGIYLVEYGREINNFFPYLNTLLCMSIGIPLFFCVTIISNKKGFTKKQNLIFNLIASVVLVLIYFTLPDTKSTHNTSLPYIKYAIYNITCHLFVSFVPFAFTRQLNAFWHYNKILFIRFLESLIYSGFIYLGLILALTSLKLLFDVDLHNELFFEIWIVTISFFNTWFFVGGIPNDFDELESNYDYPKGLRVFAQFVLLPLIGLYLLILYSYGSKIILTWDWPRGIVSYLIICVSILGILTFLLIHPYGEQKDHAWIKKTSKGYYFLLFPLLIIFFISIFIRINDYGVTINRYVILLLGIWLSIVCIYTAIGKTNIKFIPTSLAILMLIVSFGPWGMFSISEKSQVNRLKHILEQSKILIDDKIQNEPIWKKDSLPQLISNNSELMNETKLSDSLHNEVMSILEYLDNHHGFSMIRNWYSQDLDAIVDQSILKKEEDFRFYDEAEIYMKSLGLKYEFKDEELTDTSIDYEAKRNTALKSVSGYDYIINFEEYIYDEPEYELVNFKIDTINYTFSFLNNSTNKLSLSSKNMNVDFKLKECIDNIRKKYHDESFDQVPISEMLLLDSNQNFKIKIEFQNLELLNNKIERISGDIYIKRK